MRAFMSARFAQFILAVFMFGFLAGYQNCGPVQFSKTDSSADKVTTSGGDPSTCDGGTCNPPEYNCSGFSMNTVVNAVIPAGQTTIPLTFSGSIGHAAPPMRWRWSWVNGFPTPSGNGSGIGSVQPNGVYTLTQPMSVGEYDMMVLSGDNGCWQNTRFSITQGGGTCEPSANQIIASAAPTQVVLTDPSAGAEITLTISNISQLSNVRIDWGDASQPTTTTSGTNTHRYFSPGGFTIRVTANDETCQNPLAVNVGPIRIDPPACVPNPSGILLTKTSSPPDVVGKPVTWNISNWSGPGPAVNFSNVTVNYGDGTPTVPVTNGILSHTYTHPSQRGGFQVTVNGTERTCQSPVSGNTSVVIENPTCVPTLSANDINVTYSAVPSSTTPNVEFYVNALVTFNVTNPSQWQGSGASFTWQLSNGDAGSSTAISPPTHQFTDERPTATNAAPHSLIVSARGPGNTTCGATITKTFNYRVKYDNHIYQFPIGAGEVKPPVKLFFIVDNSKTMLNKQTRLASAYQSMFASGGSSLVGFDVTTYVINTAQYSIQKAVPSNPGSSPLIYPTDNVTGMRTNVLEQMVPRRSNDSFAASYTLSMLNSQLRFAGNIGQIAGDVLGVRNSFPGYTSAQSPTAQYEVAPVTKFATNPNTSNGLPLIYNTNIKTGPNAGASEIQQLALDFQQRVALLNPDLYVDQNTPNYEAVTLAESGHCSIARVLRESSRYLSPGDKPAFIIVSDENDSYTSGSNCIYQSGAITKYIGHCQAPGTQFGYDRGNLCTRRYPNFSTITYDTKVTNFQYTVHEQTCHGTDTGTVCEWNDDNDSGSNAGWPSSVPANTPPGNLPITLTSAQCRAYLNLVDTSTRQYLNISCSADKATQTYTSYPATPVGQSCTPPSTVNYITGTCLVTRYTLPYATDQVPVDTGFACVQANAAHYCVAPNGNPLPNCTISLNPDYYTFVEPGTGLQCNSTCVAGGNCANQTYEAYIQGLGGRNCQVTNSNAGFIASYITNYVVDDGHVCPVGQTFIHTNQQTVQSTDYVGGTSTNGSPQNLKTYITNQLAQLEANHVLKATATAFVYRPSEYPNCNPVSGNNCPGATDPGTSMDQQYGPLLNAINGNANLDRYFRIDSTDYSPALTQVSSFINSQLIRTYNLPINPTGLVIDSVTWKGILLTRPGQYTVNGTTIIFNDSLAVAIGDSIVVSYHYQ